MGQIKIGDMVWCNMGTPAYESDGNFVGTVNSIKDGKYVVSRDRNPFVYKMHTLSSEQLTILKYRPMDYKKETKAGWITKLMQNISGNEILCFAWIHGAGKGDDSIEYPVKYWITADGILKIQKYTDEPDAFNRAINIINDIFNCNPNSKIVAHYTMTESTLAVRLFELVEKASPVHITMTEGIKLAMVAINKWMYFGWNYQLVERNGITLPKFLVETKWTCNLPHMIDKQNTITRKKNPHAYLSTFYCELDTENRKALIEWVMLNYNGEIKILEEHP